MFNYIRLLVFPFQYIQRTMVSQTSVMKPLLFSLLRIKGLYMFRALLAHPQKSLHKQHLVYWYNVSWLWHGCSFTAIHQMLFV
jgi:hypothetical protein